MRSISDSQAGVSLDLDDYYRDFEHNFWRGRGFWKLERQQSFAEPGNPSWEAFSQGRWGEALRIIEAGRRDLVDYHERLAAIGSFARRIRVVSLPLAPYLQWELHALKVRDEAGGPIRTIDASRVAELEADSPLPEIYTIGDDLMYEANYDEHGVLASATKYTDSSFVRECRDLITMLYDRGEPLASFFEREVSHLPPPRMGQHVPPIDYLERTGRPRPIRS